MVNIIKKSELKVMALYPKLDRLKSWREVINSVPTKKNKNNLPLSFISILNGILSGNCLGIVSFFLFKSNDYIFIAVL